MLHIGLNLNRIYRVRLVEHDRQQSVYRRLDTAVLVTVVDGKLEFSKQ